MKDGERSREPTPQERERALFYAREWLIPLRQLEPGQRTAAVRELSQQQFDIPYSQRHSVSEATLWRLAQLYEVGGLDALYRKPRHDAGSLRILPVHILERAIKIRVDLPSRSLRRILEILKAEYPLEIDQVKSSTLSHALTAAGHPRIRRRRASKNSPMKERHIHMKWERPLQLVQSDVCGDTLWVTQNGKVQKASLIAVLDHCSKFCLHGEWVVSANLPALEKCVTQSLLAYGIFERLHVDNGAIYVSYLLTNVCAEMGIDLRFSRPGYAPGKGGIERFWLTVEEDFIPEVGDSTRFTLAELNQKYRAWEHEYNRRVHSATGEAPLERLQRLQGEPRWPDPVKLRRAALLRESRVVDKRFCTVSVRCVEFAVDPSLRGKRVQVRYDPFLLDEVLVYDQHATKLLQRAVPQPADSAPAPFLPPVPAHRTPKIDVLESLEKRMKLDQRAGSSRRRPEASKPPIFAAFCQQVGRLLERESTLHTSELDLLRECWERYGPFAEEFVGHTMAPLVAHVGCQLHLVEYLNALVAAHLSQTKEEE